MKWKTRRRRQRRRRIAVHQSKYFLPDFRLVKSRQTEPSSGSLTPRRRGSPREWAVHWHRGWTACWSFVQTVDPAATLPSGLFSHIVFITSQCDRWGEIASMFGGTFLSPVIRGAPVWVPQWDLSLDKSQPRICLYSCIQAPRLTVTSSLWCCSLLWKHPWVFGELFCSFVYALTKCMSHIIRTLFSERRSS